MAITIKIPDKKVIENDSARQTSFREQQARQFINDGFLKLASIGPLDTRARTLMYNGSGGEPLRMSLSESAVNPLPLHLMWGL